VRVQIIRRGSIRDGGHSLPGQIVRAANRSVNLPDRQRRGQLRSVERYEDHSYKHPEDGKCSREPLMRHSLGLCGQARDGPIGRFEDAWNVAPVANDAILTTAFEQSDQMPRDEHKNEGDAEPHEGRLREEQIEQVLQSVSRLRFPGITHHNLHTRLHDGQRKV
jgi:hypothetical protein